MTDHNEKANVGTGSEKADGAARRTYPTRVERAARARAEKEGVHIPADYRRKKAEVFDRRLVRVLGDGFHRDAATKHLYLSVKGKARSYIYRYKQRATGKDTHLGLGTVEVDLQRIRDKACEYNELLARGRTRKKSIKRRMLVR
jgi:hypothetical protein